MNTPLVRPADDSDPYGDPAVTEPNGAVLNEMMLLLSLVERGDLKARLQLIERFRELTGYAR